MSRIYKFLNISLISLFIFLFFTLLLASLLIIKSIPDYNRVVTNSLVNKDVEVYRNKFAIPNIVGKTNDDIFFALGYVHAQDRLWQMILLRKAAKGKLAELFGDKYLKTDKFVRTLDIYNSSKKSVDYLSNNTKSLLTSYSNGINKRLLDIQKEGLGRGSPNLFLFPPKITPWTPADSLAILKFYDLLNNDSAKNEVIRLNLLNFGLSFNKLLDLYPDLPDISKNYKSIDKIFFSKKKQKEKKSKNLDNNLFHLENIFQKNVNNNNASNIWAAIGNRTASGNTLVGYNIHTNFEIPIIWMMARLELETGPVIGVTIPGIPIILIGRSKYFSWGVASSKIDNQDLIIEILNKKNKMEYKTIDGFKKFNSRDILIKVKDRPGITYSILSSENGPILPSDAYGIKTLETENSVIALKWTGLDSKDKSIESFINLLFAKNIEEAKKSLKNLVVPSFNFLLANENTSEIISAGKIPIRNVSSSFNYGIIPSIGGFQKNYWLGNLNYSKNSKIKILENGIIFNTNNKLIEKKYPNHHSYDWGSYQRYFRMKNIFEKRKYHTLDSFKEIQTDNISSSARTLLPLLGKNLWYSQVLNIKDQQISLRQKAIDLLAEWNGEMSVYLIQPLIYNSWASQFQKMVIQDEIGGNINWFKSINPEFLERVLRNINGASKWCDIKQTSKIETCEEISLNALDNSLVILSKNFGNEMESWLWGNHHKAQFLDKIIGKYPIVSYLTNIIFEVPGGDNTLSLNRSDDSLKFKHHVRYGSTLRVIMDFSDLNESYFSIPTGQSGHFLSKNYADFLELWQRNEYVKLPLSNTSEIKEKNDMMLITNSSN